MSQKKQTIKNVQHVYVWVSDMIRKTCLPIVNITTGLTNKKVAIMQSVKSKANIRHMNIWKIT